MSGFGGGPWILLISSAWLFLSPNAHSQYEYDDETCSSIGGDERNCIPLKYCSSLLNLIRSRPLLKKNLRKLVNLTCEFEEPKVCCALEDILEVDIPLSVDEDTAVVSPLPLSLDIDRSFRSHPSFGKIPSYEKCSLSLSQYSGRKPEGNQTLRGQFPWSALLGYQNGTSGGLTFLCGGTIISKRYILTSAMCIRNKGHGPPVKVRLGEHDLRHDPDCSNSEEIGCSYVQDFDIDNIVAHQDFDFEAAKRGSKFENDIALIRLRKDIVFDIYVQPVCLPFVKDYDLRDFPKRLESVTRSSTVGWGRTIWTSPSSSVMQFTTFPIKPNEECAIQYFNQTGVKASQICAGGDVPNFCCGDSGSALMITHRERSMPKYFQVGITSFGPFNCRSSPLPGLFTRVSSHFDWILSSIE